MPQVYIKDSLYHRIVGSGLLTRTGILQFIEEAVEEKISATTEELKHIRGE
jgi:hypothetical protein